VEEKTQIDRFVFNQGGDSHPDLTPNLLNRSNIQIVGLLLPAAAR
jgi:hypothetical protein